MKDIQRDAIKRAIELFEAVNLFIANNPVSDYQVFYDEAMCDGECLRNDCVIARDELMTVLEIDEKWIGKP